MNANNPVPPILNPPRATAGRTGLALSLVAPATIALMVLLHPG